MLTPLTHSRTVLGSLYMACDVPPSSLGARDSSNKRCDADDATIRYIQGTDHCAGTNRPHFGIMPVIKNQITALRRHNA